MSAPRGIAAAPDKIDLTFISPSSYRQNRRFLRLLDSFARSHRTVLYKRPGQHAPGQFGHWAVVGRAQSIRKLIAAPSWHVHDLVTVRNTELLRFSIPGVGYSLHDRASELRPQALDQTTDCRRVPGVSILGQVSPLVQFHCQSGHLVAPVVSEQLERDADFVDDLAEAVGEGIGAMTVPLGENLPIFPPDRPAGPCFDNATARSLSMGRLIGR